MAQTRARLLELSQLLESWKWLALSRPTHILVDGVLDGHTDIIDPMSSLPVEGHIALLSGDIEVTLPPLIRDFVVSTARLELSSAVKFEEHKPPSAPQKKTSAKKQHETSRLTQMVSSICASQSLTSVVDIGSGLGYVDRELCRAVEDCEVLAIESEEARCASADVANRMVGFGERIKQLPIKLQGSNVKEVSDNVNLLMKDSGCLIALHACGDLTPTALRLFNAVPLLRSAVILSCCYHKMSAAGGGFLNFPMSNFLKERFASGSVDSDLADVSFLRLAAESTKEMWAARGVEQLSLHARSVAYRALVELYEHQKEIKFSKKVRKAVKASSRKNWTAYVAAWVGNTDALRLSDNHVMDKDFLLEDLVRFRSEREIGELTQRTMAFNTLKSCIQHLAELLVLEDRLLALTEAGFPNSNLVRVSDPSISPRSIAIAISR